MKQVGIYTRGALMAALLTGCVSGTVLAAAAAADTDLQTYTLDEVVVTATRTENKKVDTPANVTVVDAKKIEEHHYQDVVEALRDVPGAEINSNGTFGVERKLKLNGDERVLVLVDGKRVNVNVGSMTRSTFDANTLPPVDSIERIEILKGAGSTLYGSDAVGGVVNIITKKADHNYGTARVGFGSWGAQNYGFTYNGKTGKTGFSISADRERQSFTKYKDYATNNTVKWQDPTDYDQKKVSLKINQDFTADTSLGFFYDYSRMDGHSSWDATMSMGPNPVDKVVNNVGIQYDWGKTKENQGYARIYRNHYGYYNYGEIGDTTTGVDVQQAWRTSASNKVVVGASYYHAGAYNELAYPEGEGINTKAIFAQDEWQFAPTWQLNTGLRYDNHSEAGSKTTGSIAVNKKFNENSNAYLSWGQVFRAPTIDDLYYYEDYGSYGKWAGDPNLKPETGDQWTLGYNVQTSPSTTLGVSAFYAQMKDAISWYWNDDWTEDNPHNIAKQRRRGLELTASHKLNDNFDLEAAYNYVSVEADDSSATGVSGYVRDARVIPNVYRLGVKYHNARWNVDLTGKAGTGADTDDNNKFGYYMGSHYFTLDLSAKYKINKHLGAYLNLYNLNNAAYSEQANVKHTTSYGSYYDYYPMAGRRFMAGVTYTF
jgi:vitamin B12 transporter